MRDEVEQDLFEGNLTESADGAEALWEILGTVVLGVVYVIAWVVGGIVRIFRK